eukprot:scaffold117023_cov27-Prasinocladus_malaysianus.AAC.2
MKISVFLLAAEAAPLSFAPDPKSFPPAPPPSPHMESSPKGDQSAAPDAAEKSAAGAGGCRESAEDAAGAGAL